MMRGDDPQDMADMEFLVRHDPIAPDAIEAAIAAVVLPDLTELRDAFAIALPRVRDAVRLAASTGFTET